MKRPRASSEASGLYLRSATANGGNWVRFKARFHFGVFSDRADDSNTEVLKSIKYNCHSNVESSELQVHSNAARTFSREGAHGCT